MAGRFFRATIRERAVSTARRRLEVHQVELRMEVLGPDGRYAAPALCLWDTGAELSVMGEDTARDLGLPLDEETDESGLRGVTGAVGGTWVVPRFVRFPGLDGFRFRIHFMVLKGVTGRVPLLGMRDTYRNFDVVSNRDAVYFCLKANHAGEQV